jgi:hypothetical protein
MSFLHKVFILREIVVGMLGFCMVNLMYVPSLVANTSMGGTTATRS